VIVLDVSEIKQLRQSWVAIRGLPPTPSQEAALIERAIEDEILLREGWSRGVPEEDPVVAERLKRIGRFVSQHGEEEALEGSDAVERAKELGLDRGDVVIRRYLIAMMRLAIGREVDWSLPTEEEIEAHLRNHPERFAWAPRVELTHVFVSSRRGEEREESARQLLAELASMPPEKAGELGDPFPRGREFLAATPELGRIFGKAFAKEVEGLEVGVWSGPIQSAYGSHLVWVHQRLPETLPALDQVRSQVVHHLLRVRREGHLRQRLGELRDRYEIRVAGARWEGAALRRPSAAPEIAFEDGSCTSSAFLRQLDGSS
jgi:hypothetical protein